MLELICFMHHMWNMEQVYLVQQEMAEKTGGLIKMRKAIGTVPLDKDHSHSYQQH